MKIVEVVGVRVEMPTNQPLVLLREQDGNRYLPIWIGAAEASAIAFAEQGITPPRPLTHDLLLNVIAEMNVELVRVNITKMDEGVFYAELVFSNGSTVSARPSDAIALALRAEVDIYADDQVLAVAGVAVPEVADVEVEAFREFLDSVNPEDFESGDFPQS